MKTENRHFITSIVLSAVLTVLMAAPATARTITVKLQKPVKMHQSIQPESNRHITVERSDRKDAKMTTAYNTSTVMKTEKK